jgi:hypothetical protein
MFIPPIPVQTCEELINIRKKYINGSLPYDFSIFDFQSKPARNGRLFSNEMKYYP